MLSENEARDALIVALDCDRERALELAGELVGHAGWVKVGMTLFYEAGPDVVREMSALGLKVFLDLKLHDIPFQVEGAARAAALTGADLLSVHALGSAAMVEGARRGVEAAALETGRPRARLLAITVLTSMDQAALASVGVGGDVAGEVERLATLARGAGADGLVCSPREVSRLRSLLGPEPLLVTPGVRPAGAAVGDQARVATPSAALAAGASKLVVGRPITQAADPVAACDAIVAELMGKDA